MKNFSAKLVYNTGFGVISVRTDIKDGYPTNLTYNHYSGESCEAKDSFVMVGNKEENVGGNDDEEKKAGFVGLIVRLGLASLGTVLIILIAYKIAVSILKRTKKLS